MEVMLVARMVITDLLELIYSSNQGSQSVQSEADAGPYLGRTGDILGLGHSEL